MGAPFVSHYHVSAHYALGPLFLLQFSIISEDVLPSAKLSVSCASYFFVQAVFCAGFFLLGMNKFIFREFYVFRVFYISGAFHIF